MKKFYQYHVYNDHCDTIVTVDIEGEEVARGFAKGCLRDFYGKTEEHVRDLNVVFLSSFYNNAIAVLDLLQKRK